MADQISGVGSFSGASDALVDLMMAIAPEENDPAKAKEKAMTGSISTDQAAPSDPSAVHLGTNAQVNPQFDTTLGDGAGMVAVAENSGSFLADSASGTSPDLGASPASGVSDSAVLLSDPQGLPVPETLEAGSTVSQGATLPELAQTAAAPDAALATAVVQASDYAVLSEPKASASPSVQEELQVYPLNVVPVQAEEPAAPGAPAPEAPAPEAPVDAAPSDPAPQPPAPEAPSDPAPQSPAPEAPAPEEPVDAAPSDPAPQPPAPEAPVDAAPSDPAPQPPAPEAPVDAAPSDPAPQPPAPEAPVDAAPSDPAPQPPAPEVTAPEAPVDAAPSDPAPQPPAPEAPVDVAPVNAIPAITFEGGGDGAWPLIDEGTTFVGRITATDADAGTTLNYAIVGGGDAGLFTIDAQTGDLRFINAPDFETPTDADGDRMYQVQVAVSDGVTSDTQLVYVRIADVNEMPVVTSVSGVTVSENATGVAYTVVAVDPDAGTTLSYSLSGTDAALFNIDATTGAVSFRAAPNFEAAADAGADNVYDVTVSVSDGTNTTSQAVAITVSDANEAAVFTSGAGASFAENATGTVYTASATDPEAAGLSYSLSGTDAALFDIDATTGAVSFRAAPNFEAAADAGADNVYDVTVSASDGTNTTSQAVAITVNDVNEAPTGILLEAQHMVENNNGTDEILLNVFDPDSSAFSFDVSDNRFEVHDHNGEYTLRLKAGVPLDREAEPQVALTVTVTDAGGLSFSHAVVLDIIDVNEAAVFTSGAGATVTENTTGTVYTASATDPEAAGLSYSLSGTDAALFDIDAATGAVSFRAAPNFEAAADAGADNIYDVTVSASDGTNTTSQAVAITVSDVAENSLLTSGNDTYVEAGAAELSVDGGAGNDILTGGSGNDTIFGSAGTDSITGGAGNDRLDGGNTEATNIINFSGDRIFYDFFFNGNGTFSHNDQRVSGPNDGNDTISNFSVFNYGSTTWAPTYGTLGNNNAETTTFSTTSYPHFAQGGNDILTGSSANDSIYGEAGNDTLTGNAGDDFLDGGIGNDIISGGTGNDRLRGGDGNDTITGGTGDDVLFAGAGTDTTVLSGSWQEYTITQGTDVGGDYFILTDKVSGRDGTDKVYGVETFQFKDRAITVSQASDLLNDGPTGAAWQAGNLVNENSSNGKVVGTVTALDPDAGDAFTYALTDNAGGRFAINATTGKVTVADGSQLDYEAATVHAIEVQVTDAAGATTTQQLTVTVGDVAENITLSSGNDTYVEAGVAELSVDGGDSTDWLVGGDGKDTLDGGLGNDDLTGAAGDDTLLGADGDDWLKGGLGNDILYGSAGGDTLNGDADNDTLIGGDGTDRLLGGDGTDLLEGGDSTDWLEGGDGSDTLNGNAGNDDLSGDAGNDQLTGDAGNDWLKGGDGSDILNGDNSLNLIVNGSFEDLGSAADNVTASFGVSTGDLPGWTRSTSQPFEAHSATFGGVSGGDGNYWLDLDASPGNVNISQSVSGLNSGENLELSVDMANRSGGSTGFAEVYWNGQLVGTLDNTSAAAKTYNFEVTAGSGDGTDTLTFMGIGAADNVGASIDNVKLVHAGHDVLEGGAGEDTLYGNGGNDVLTGGNGNDQLWGDDGSDLFIFAASDGNDTVHGGAGLGWTDSIDLRDAGAPQGNWTLELSDGTIFTSSDGSGAFDLGQDKSGSITFADGHTINFDTLERVTWG